MILASHFGWSIFPDPPTFADYLLMAHHLSEERVGRRLRQQAGTSAAQEADREQRLRQFSE